MPHCAVCESVFIVNCSLGLRPKPHKNLELELELILSQMAQSQCCGAKWACMCDAHEVRREGEVWGKRRSARRLNEYTCVVKPVRAYFWRDAFFDVRCPFSYLG